MKPGGRVVAAGPKLASRYPGKLLGPLVEAAFRRFAVSRADRDRPWRLLALRVPGLQVQEVGPGVLFRVWDTIG